MTRASQALAAALAEQPKRSKYRNKVVVVDGQLFASQREARRYGELKLMERAGRIRDLKLQPRFPLFVNCVLVCTYIADFSYLPALDGGGSGKLIVEDAKGFRTREYITKSKLFRAVLGFPIVEV